MMQIDGRFAVLLMWGISTLAQAESPQFHNTQNPNDKLSHAGATVANMQVPAGFRVQLFAEEPHVQQPIAFTIDERGRLWVVENYTYGEREVNFDLQYHDRIVILEDENHDGRFDKRTVFWDQGHKLTSVEIGFGGVWVLAAPQLLWIPDRNRDDVPDGKPIVLLDGWDEDKVRHNIVNGLKWGPDGWLYGRHGIQAISHVGPPGTPPEQRTPMDCGIWRYHPVTRKFEVVARGTTNPWGFDYNDHGQMFFINTVIGHLWHVIPGAHLRRMYGLDANPHAYQLITQTADHFHWDTGEAWSDIRKIGVSPSTDKAGGGHAHIGLMFYLGDNWPTRYRDTIFTVNMHGLRLNNDRLERKGNGYVGKHCPDFLKSPDPWFRCIDLTYGPDGGVYMIDWADIGECHENDGVHRTSGRVYKISYGTPALPTIPDVSQLTDDKLVDLQLHQNDWYVRISRRILQERAAAGKDMSAVHRRLKAMLTENEDVSRRLRALWCLAVTNDTDTELLQSLLADSSEHVRVWAIRLLCDQPPIAEHAVQRFAEMASSDVSGLVRLFLASALQKIPTADRWGIARGLAGHGEDSEDNCQPLMIWYGIEPAVPLQPQQAVQLAAESRIPLLRRHIARRLTHEIDRSPASVDKLLALIDEQRPVEFQRDILQGMNEALRGWNKAPLPPQWRALASSLGSSSDEQVRSLIQELSVVFGDGRSRDELITLLKSSTTEPSARQNALRILNRNPESQLLPIILPLLKDRDLRLGTIKALASYKATNIPRTLIGWYPKFNNDERQEALNTLVSRAEYARELLTAIGRKVIPASDVTAFHARQILSFSNESLNQLLSEHWGELRQTPEEKKQQIETYKQKLTPEVLADANPQHGRELFNKTCAACHLLFGEGQKDVGPDLTGANRSQLSYLLENLIDPNAIVAVNYQMSVVVLDSGRVFNGVVLEKSDRTVTLQTQQERLVLDRDEIELIKPTPVSLMPEGQLQQLSADEVRDLIGYLMSQQQVPLTEASAK